MKPTHPSRKGHLIPIANDTTTIEVENSTAGEAVFELQPNGRAGGTVTQAGQKNKATVSILLTGKLIARIGVAVKRLLGRVEAKLGNPTGIEELLKEGFEVGSVKMLGEVWQRIVHRDKSLAPGGEGSSLALANDSDPATIEVENSTAGEAVFELQPNGRWFVPFGQYQHDAGLQIVDADAGEALRKSFHGLASRIRGLFTKAGVPVYFGHPDMKGRADSNPAAPARGWVEDVTVENDGISFGIALNEDGLRAVEKKEFRFYSPFWNCARLGGGRLRPVKLNSIGLTNNPRIPVPALANDGTEDGAQGAEDGDRRAEDGNESPETTPPTKETTTTMDLKKLAALLGLDPETATEESINAALEALLLEKAEGEKLKAESGKRKAEAEALEARAVAAENDLAAANDATKAARGKRIAVEIAALNATARLLPAENDATTTELLALENDAALDARLAELHAAAPKLKTQPATADLGKAKATIAAANDATARSTSINDAIAEAAAANQFNLGTAEGYQAARNEARRKAPELFR